MKEKDNGLRNYLMQAGLGLLIGALGTAVSFGVPLGQAIDTKILILNGTNHGLITIGLLLTFFTDCKKTNKVLIAILAYGMSMVEVCQLPLGGRVFDWWDIISPLIILGAAWIYNDKRYSEATPGVFLLSLSLVVYSIW